MVSFLKQSALWLLTGCFCIGAESTEDENLVTPDEDPGFVEPILRDLESGSLGEGEAFTALHPANTTSPRNTIISFFKLTQRFYDLIQSEEYSPTDRLEVMHLFGQMEEFFDLREVAPSLREAYASASGIYLREIIDRIGLPPLEEIPNEHTMQEAIRKGYPPRWTIPNTPFEIIRIDSGEEEGHYLFSEETLRQVKPLFGNIRHLPYRSESAAKDFYYYYFLTPNPIIPREWIENLPSWTQKDFLEQTVWQWLSMLAVLLLAGFSIWLLRRLVRRIFAQRSATTRSLAWLAVPLWAIIAFLICLDLIGDKIFITGEVFEAVVYLIYTVILIAALVLTFMLGTLVADILTGSRRLKYRSFDAHLARIGIRIASLIVCVVILIEGLHEIGFSLATVIAGAGVTGLAVALAAQSTLRNIFGSLMLLLDKPFRVGQRVVVSGHDGTVEEIGLRSTKIRLLNGHVTSIPNERMADAEIENIGMRPFIKRVTNIGIPYHTPRDKVDRAVESIREILTPTEEIKDHSPLNPEDRADDPTNASINHPDFPPRVYFSEFNPDCLNILVMYWYHPPDYWEFLQFNQRINRQIMAKFEEAQIDFALPSRTVHLNTKNEDPGDRSSNPEGNSSGKTGPSM